MGRKRREPPEEEQLVCLNLVRSVLPHCRALDPAVHRVHGNVQLQLTDTLLVLLAAFFNPMVRSLRLVEELSQMPWVQGHLNVDRICKSTLSDAFDRFDPQALLPVIRGLMDQIPQLKRRDADLETVCRQVVAADGSMFNLASDVAWALMRPKRDGKTQAQCRLNLQLCIDSYVPVNLSVSGADEGSEAGAFSERVLSGVIYLMDRNFVHFGLINRVLDNGSDLVLRLRKDTNFQTVQDRSLTARDVEAGVISDRVGVLSGGKGSRTGPPPNRPLREVVVRDPETGTNIRLLTNLLDQPAHVIGALYRARWHVELFLRWLKVWAGMEHLISHRKKGITFQFYVAVIACLLMHIRTGRRVNKYTLFLMGQVACGLATWDRIAPILDRVEREKELERQRYQRKKRQKALEAASKTKGLLPG